MSDTTFVVMFNPNLGNVQVDAPLQAVATYQSHGWLLLDPGATPPPVASPYLSQPAADSRYLRDWAGAEVLTAGAVRVAPDGHVIVRVADGTTRSTYDGTEAALWTALGGANDPALRAAFEARVSRTSAATGQVPVLQGDGSLAFGTIAASGGGGLSARTMVAIGDSILAQNNGPTLGPTTAVNPYNYWSARGYLTWMQTLLGHRFKILSNAGVGGQTTAQMDTRFASDVVAYAPAWADIQGGGNDISQGRTAAQIIASLQSMYDKARNAGIKVHAHTVMTSQSFAGATLTSSAASGQNQIVVNATPGTMVGDTLIIDTGTSAETTVVASAATSTGLGQAGTYTVTMTANLTKSHASGVPIYNVTKMGILATVNAWLHSYWRANPNGVLSDFSAVYADPTTGGPVASLCLDGAHPSIDGAIRLGKAAADAIERFVQREVHGGGNSPGNLLGSKGGMVGTGGASSGFTGGGSCTGAIAAGWTMFAGSGTEVLVGSKVARTDNIPGEWQQFVVSGGGASYLSFNANNSNAGVDWAIGDTVWAEIEFLGGADVVPPSRNGPMVNLNLLAQGNGAVAQAMQASSGSDGASTLWPVRGWLRTNVMQVPTSTTGLYVQIGICVTSGTFSVGRVRLVKGAL